MRTNLCGLVVLASALCLQAVAADFGRTALPEPAKSGGMALSQALAERHSGREFADTDLTQQQLADLLWSVAGVNRPDGRKTYPVSMNRHDMTVYVFVREGIYRYDPAANALEPVAAGDHRAAAGTQPFVGTAAVNLAYVQDMSLWQDSPGQPERGLHWGFAHAGAMMQNGYLFAAGQGWSAVIRGLFDAEAMKTLLQLPESQHVRLVQSIGPRP